MMISTHYSTRLIIRQRLDLSLALLTVYTTVCLQYCLYSLPYTLPELTSAQSVLVMG